MGTTLLVLGSGQDAGSPQVGRGSGIGPPRSASSIAVAVDDGPLLLFDASPDLRQQDARLRSAGFSARGQNPYDAVFLTHAHMGHYVGLAHFGKEGADTVHMPTHGPQSLIDYLASNQPWKALIDNRNLDEVAVENGPARYGNLTVSGVPVPHRAEFSTTVGYSISVDGRPWAFYVPDIDSWDEWPDAEEVLSEHSVCLVDAAFGRADELPGRDLSAIPHPLVTDTIRRFAGLTNERRMILTHINHSNTLADPTSELAIAAARAGFEVARDGLTIRSQL